MAVSLQDVVQTYYKSTYTEAGSSLAPCTVLTYIGLQTCTLYDEQIVATGQQAAPNLVAKAQRGRM
jgi:hypothetical protein